MSNAYPTITTSDGEKWDTVTGPEAYKDEATGPEWITFKREISPGNWKSIIENDVNGTINFKWKSDKVIGNRSSFRSIKLYRNSVTNELSLNHDTKGDDWEIVDPFEYNKQNRSRLDFIFNAFGATIWIAFPPQPVQTSPVLIQNRPPNRPMVNISSDVKLRVGNMLCISANAIDPDNDSIDYYWDWDDGTIGSSHGIPSRQDVTQCHYWSEEGPHKIKVTALDSFGANSSMINLTVLRPEPPTKPELNISSDGFLWLGDVLCISANSTDHNNDSIDYSWDWGDGTINQSHGVHSGDAVTQCHNWSRDGSYEIIVTASNSNGSNFSILNLSVLRPNPPELPTGTRIGYIDVIYKYSTKIDLPQGKIRYIFNWGDSTQDIPIELEVGKEAIANHVWAKPGEYKVRVAALDSKDNPSEYSKELNVIIYYKKNISNKQDLQYEIEINSTKYEELVLIDSTYDVGELLIKNKEHLALNSGKSYANLSGSKVENRIVIENSSFINITRMNLSHSTTGIRLLNANNSTLKSNIMSYMCGGFGIEIEGGEWNNARDNQIIYIFDHNHNSGAGIALNNTRYNEIQDNEINSSPPERLFLSYYVADTKIMHNNITVKNLNTDIGNHNRDIQVRQGNCCCGWNANGIQQGSLDTNYETSTDCAIKNDADRNKPHVWYR